METKTELQAQLGLYARQTDVFNPANAEHQKHIVIVGAGTIGSWLVFGLSKLGFSSVTVIDDDTVELHNCSNQLFIPSQVGKPKVDSLVSIMKGFSLTPPQIIRSKLNESSLNIFPDTILVSAVDNMATRKAMFDLFLANPNIVAFVDGRMGGQVIRVYGVKRDDEGAIKAYGETLYSDDSSDIVNEELRKASDTPCTARSIVDVSFMVSGKMIGNIRKFATNQTVCMEFIFDAKNDIVMV